MLSLNYDFRFPSPSLIISTIIISKLLFETHNWLIKEKKEWKIFILTNKKIHNRYWRFNFHSIWCASNLWEKI